MMKRRLFALVMLIVLCVPLLAACQRTVYSPSQEDVEACARDVLWAVMQENTAGIRALANPDYVGYFTEEEMKPYYEQYEKWGICNADISIGSMRLVEWDDNVNYPAGYGSEALYEVSIGGRFYEYEIHVVATDAGAGVVFFDLFQLE